MSYCYFLPVHSFANCIEKMKTHYIGEFLYRCSSVEAARLELDKLYLKDFVAIVLKPASHKEVQVGLVYISYSQTRPRLLAIIYWPPETS